MIKLRNRVFGKNQVFYLFIHLISIFLALNVRSQEVRHELDTLLWRGLWPNWGDRHISAIAGKASQSLGAGDRRLEFSFELCFELAMWPWTSLFPSRGLCVGGVKFDMICGTILPCGPRILWFFFNKMVLFPVVSISWGLCSLCRKMCEFHLLRGFQTANPTSPPCVKAFLGPRRESGVCSPPPWLWDGGRKCHCQGLRTPRGSSAQRFPELLQLSALCSQVVGTIGARIFRCS